MELHELMAVRADGSTVSASVASPGLPDKYTSRTIVLRNPTQKIVVRDSFKLKSTVLLPADQKDYSHVQPDPTCTTGFVPGTVLLKTEKILGFETFVHQRVSKEADGSK